MRERARNIARKAWAHCTGPITIRSLVFVAVMVAFFWALFDRLAVRDHNKAIQHRLEIYSMDTQKGLAQIHHSWAKFDEVNRQVLANQRAMQDEIAEQTAILKTERTLRERQLAAGPPNRPPANGIKKTAPKRRPARKPASKPRACFVIDEQITRFGNGAEVKKDVLVSVPCP